MLRGKPFIALLTWHQDINLTKEVKLIGVLSVFHRIHILKCKISTLILRKNRGDSVLLLQICLYVIKLSNSRALTDRNSLFKGFALAESRIV